MEEEGVGGCQCVIRPRNGRKREMRRRLPIDPRSFDLGLFILDHVAVLKLYGRTLRSAPTFADARPVPQRTRGSVNSERQDGKLEACPTLKDTGETGVPLPGAAVFGAEGIHRGVRGCKKV